MILFKKLAENEKPINEYLSKKISIISLFSAFAVVLIHSWNWGYSDSSTGITHDIEYFFSQALCRSAVPFFFACSGYLLCATLTKAELKALLPKLKKRIKTILLPWILWLVIGIIFSWLWMRFLSVWTNSAFYCKWEKSPNILWSFVYDYIWGDTIVHLWFLKRLMLFFICSPFFLFLFRKIKYIFPITMIVLAYFFESTYINEDLLCFILGMYLALSQIDMKQSCNRGLGSIFFIVWIVLCCIHCGDFRFVYTRNLIGIIALWTIYDTFYPFFSKVAKYLLPLTSYSFFIYCLHPCPLGVFDTFFRAKISIELLRYVFVWSGTVLTCIVIGFLLRKWCKPVYNILSGDR